MYRIAIVDDHKMFVDGIRNIIHDDPEFELLFTAHNGEEMLANLERHEIDILVLDVNLPDHNGIKMITGLKREYPRMKIMVLSMYQPSDIRLDLDRFSGEAYVLKTSGQEVLELALAALKKSESFFDPGISGQEQVKDLFTAQMKLTRREKEILSLIASGKTNKEIASLLFLSELTIQTHRRNISEKLGARGMAELIYKSIQIDRRDA